MHLVPESLDNLVTTKEAAAMLGVAEVTIRSWRLRGHLTAADHDTTSGYLYKLIDVLRAERATRQRGSGASRGRVTA